VESGCCLGGNDSSPDPFRRIATIDARRLKIGRGDWAGGQDRMSSDSDTRPHPTAGAEPRAVLHCDGLHDQIERGQFIVVTARAEKRARRNADVVANDDSLQVQQPALLAQPHVIAHRELPRKGNDDARFDDNALSDAGTKRAQHTTFQGWEAERAKPEQEKAHHQP